jgi:hypothetical protein
MMLLSDGLSHWAFHEKAGRSQVGSSSVPVPGQGFPSPSRHCRHPSIRTLNERSALGASWVFSFQPVLPPVWRPLFHRKIEVGQAIDAVTGTRLWASAVLHGGLSVCPDGRQAIYVARGTIWHLDLQNNEATKLTSGNISRLPMCLPDNTYMIFLSFEENGSKGLKQSVLRMPLAGGPPRQLTDRFVGSFAASPDGRAIALAIEDSNSNGGRAIEVIPAAGGPPIKSIPAPGLNLVGGLQYSLDGKAIYYARNKNRIGNIAMQPVSGGSPTVVTNFHDKFIFSFEYDWKRKKLAVVRGALGGDMVLISDGRSGDLQ